MIAIICSHVRMYNKVCKVCNQENVKWYDISTAESKNERCLVRGLRQEIVICDRGVRRKYTSSILDIVMMTNTEGHSLTESLRLTAYRFRLLCYS